jgi:hypothetical protein
MRTGLAGSRLAAALVVLVLLAVYWPTVFHEYGFRDDYAHLREAREIPGHLIRFTASYGRPVYGTLLVASVGSLHGEVANLQWLRLASVALLALLAIALARLLRRSGWTPAESTAVGLSIALLPAAQIIVGWSIAWPIALALVLALGGYAATRSALAASSGARPGRWAGGFVLYLIAGLIYQPCALFFVVPLAAELLLAADSMRMRVRSVMAHVGTAFGALATGFLTMRLLFTLGLLKQSAVLGIETDPVSKLRWFIAEPLANALALFALRDRFDTAAIFWVAILAFVALIYAGLYLRPNRAPVDRWTVFFCVAVLPFVAFAVNLVAALRVPSYRTTFALAGLVAVLVVHGLRNLRLAGIVGRTAQHAALGALLAAGAFAANRHAYELIAQPQGWEWDIVRAAAMAAPLKNDVKVYAIRAGIEDRATERTFADEFGSLSTDTEWAISEMFKGALRRRFPGGLPAAFGYRLTTGTDAPDGRFDVLIDMRLLRQHRAVAPVGAAAAPDVRAPR